MTNNIEIMTKQFVKTTPILLALLFMTIAVRAQVGVGTTNPHPSSVLDVSSDTGNRGLLVPNLNSTQRNSIVSPADGLLSYDPGQDNYYYNRQNTWVPLSLPRGAIIMWSGSIGAIPDGWRLCNGTGGTPNLSGRFIVAYSGSGAYASVGNTGGSASVALTTAQMPAHSHTGSTNTAGTHDHDFRDHYHADDDNDEVHPLGGGAASYTALIPGVGGVNGSGDSDDDNRHFYYLPWDTDDGGSHSHTVNTNNTGSSGAHENRPPYYVLAFIMKL